MFSGSCAGFGAGDVPVSLLQVLRSSIVSELPSSLPGIDIASGLPRVAGNAKLYVKLLRHVAAEAPATREKLSAAVMAGNADAVREVAHSLKGSCSNLSITAVAEAASQLELAAKSSDFSTIFVHLDSLETALSAYVDVVAQIQGFE